MNINPNQGNLNPQILQWFRMADSSQNGKLDFNELLVDFLGSIGCKHMN